MSAKVFIPTLLAVFALVMALKGGVIASEPQPATAAPEPTPYSAAHSSIPASNAAEESPQTF